MEATKEENDWMLPKRRGKEKQPKERNWGISSGEESDEPALIT